MKYILLLTISILSFSTVQAQYLRFGAGTALTRMKTISHLSDGDQHSTYPTEAGYAFSLDLDFLKEDYYTVYMGLMSVQKKGEESREYDRAPRNFDCVSLTTCIDLRIPSEDKLYPFLSLGMKLDYLTGHLLDSNYHWQSAGLLLGTGIKYEYKDFQFCVRSNYHLDVQSIKDNDSEYITDRTFSIFFTLGILLDITKKE